MIETTYTRPKWIYHKGQAVNMDRVIRLYVYEDTKFDVDRMIIVGLGVFHVIADTADAQPQVAGPFGSRTEAELWIKKYVSPPVPLFGGSLGKVKEKP